MCDTFLKSSGFSRGFAVLNGDDPKQVNYKLKNKVKTIWIGIDNKDVDVRATNIKCSSKGTSFDVVFKGDDTKYKYTVPNVNLFVTGAINDISEIVEYVKNKYKQL